MSIEKSSASKKEEQELNYRKKDNKQLQNIRMNPA
jgi:hypothetical protein